MEEWNDGVAGIGDLMTGSLLSQSFVKSGNNPYQPGSAAAWNVTRLKLAC